jgi:hypothetical protein
VPRPCLPRVPLIQCTPHATRHATRGKHSHGNGSRPLLPLRPGLGLRLLEPCAPLGMRSSPISLHASSPISLHGSWLLSYLYMPPLLSLQLHYANYTTPSPTLSPTDPVSPSPTLSPTDPVLPSPTLSPTDPVPPSPTLSPTDPVRRQRDYYRASGLLTNTHTRERDAREST